MCHGAPAPEFLPAQRGDFEDFKWGGQAPPDDLRGASSIYMAHLRRRYHVDAPTLLCRGLV